MRGHPWNPVRRRRPRAARLHHQPPPAPDPLPTPSQPWFELICVVPNEHDEPTVAVLRDLQPAELHALATDMLAAQQYGDLTDVLQVWSAVR